MKNFITKLACILFAGGAFATIIAVVVYFVHHPEVLETLKH